MSISGDAREEEMRDLFGPVIHDSFEPSALPSKAAIENEMVNISLQIASMAFPVGDPHPHESDMNEYLEDGLLRCARQLVLVRKGEETMGA